MALSATFAADFSSFYTAVEQAKTKLVSMDAEARKVGGTLNRMVDQFSGQKLIQQATLMVKAVQDVGGAGVLTENELKRVGRTVDEASEKMRKLGIAVPKSFQDISAAAKEVNPPTQTWASSLTNLTNLVRGFMALELVQYLKRAAQAAFDWAGSMVEMHDKTSIAYRDLQVLEDVSIETGVSMEELTKAVQTLQQRIGSGEARAGIEALGLSFDAIKRMDPAQQLTAIATALREIKDPSDQAARGAEIFGGVYRQLTPAVKANLAEIAAQTKIVADANIEAADRVADGWAKSYNNMKRDWLRFLTFREVEAERSEKELNALLAKGRAQREGGALIAPAAPSILRPTLGGPKGLGALWNQFVSGGAAAEAIGNIRVLGMTLEEQGKAAAKADTANRKYQDAIDKLRTAVIPLTAAQQKQVDLWRQQGASAGTMADALRVNETAVQQYLETIKILGTEIQTTNVAQADFTKLFGPGAIGSGLRQATLDIEALTGSLEDFKRTQKGEMFPDLVASIDQLPVVLGNATKTTLPMLQHLGSQFKTFFAKDFGQIVVGAIQGGGDAVKAALTGFGNKIFAPDGALGSAMTKGINGLFGSKGMMGQIGGMLSSMVPMIGSFLGPAIDGIGKLFKKVFGKSEESSKVSPLRDEFFKLQGGLETLNPKVQALTGNLSAVQAVFNAKTVEQYNAAIGNLTTILESQHTSLELVTATAQKYGFTLEELGPALQRQELDEQAQTLFKDWEVLNAAGIETVAITKRMAESINKYVGQALTMGQEVPAAMRPMLERMAEMGQLTDASGNKIENLENSGISFSMTMSEGFNSLIKEVQKLTDVISRSLGTALEKTADRINDIPQTIPVTVVYKEKNRPEGGSEEVPGYQEGTKGRFVDFGKGTLVMLHGKEAVVPQEQAMLAPGPSLAAAAGGGPSVTIIVNAQGAFFDTPDALQRLAEKVNAALTQKYGIKNRLKAA
jgi:hypothetical protein